jgi:phosphoribosyl 1,2-cyclic phosphodiesterase
MSRPTLEVYPLGSGSSGNATLVVGERGGVLVDAGFSARELCRRMEGRGAARSLVRAIVLTHGHTDHIRGAAVLARKLGVPIWGTAPTLAALSELRGGETLNELVPGRPATIAGLALEALAVSHDAPGTVILRVEGRLGIATDLGVAPVAVRDFLRGLDGLLLEFNHDPEMLRDGPYPPWLQARIRSDAGHLSNDQAKELLLSSVGAAPTQVLWLGHLSRHNNTPQLARRAALAGLDGRTPAVVVTHQDQSVSPVTLR